MLPTDYNDPLFVSPQVRSGFESQCSEADARRDRDIARASKHYLRTIGAIREIVMRRHEKDARDEASKNFEARWNSGVSWDGDAY